MRHSRTRLILLLALLLTIGLLAWLNRRQVFGPRSEVGTNIVTPELIARFEALEAREKEMDRTVWAKELLAQQCGHLFESWWDSLNTATNKLRLVASFPIGELVVGKFAPPEKIAHGIEVYATVGRGPIWPAAEWVRFLQESERAGWELANTEFRHVRFETDAVGRAKQSHLYFRAHLLNSQRTERAVLEGELVVEWQPKSTGAEPAAVRQVDASGVTIKTRRGEPPFVPILNEEIAPLPKTHFIDPLILYDLDGDGRSEIILAARNLVYRQRAGGRFEPDTLCRYPPGLIFTGVIADFDGDGIADFLCARFEGLVLYKGSPQGTFDLPGRAVWSVQPHLRYAQVLTCGDIDHDGDLDVFLAQYKLPYERGQMPTPYYDANDGNPSYLLLNDGRGNFTDATLAAGLGTKRGRRSYSASFADLDGDGHLDLVVVSDFAGVDLYRNDGRGHFTDVTHEWVPEAHAFGMAHALADINSDGRLDLLMIGMNSPTADRLNALDLWRPGIVEDRSMRASMTYGNRLFLGRAQGGFAQTPLNNSIARSGWSWGCAVADFDNDGFPDVYIANGHETRKTVHDYEPEFWLHDIFVSNSQDDAVAQAFFQSRFSSKLGGGHSYGGYEKNRLYLNQDGSSFVEAGHLMGVALEEDSRCVVADDLDGDGRLDLLVTTFEAWPGTKQTLRVFKNTMGDDGNWIGFHFREQGSGPSPVGAVVTLHHVGGSMVRQIVTGDSYRSQQPNAVHFGLGKIAQVESVEIRWANGSKLSLPRPAINHYHNVNWSPAPQGP